MHFERETIHPINFLGRIATTECRRSLIFGVLCSSVQKEKQNKNKIQKKIVSTSVFKEESIANRKLVQVLASRKMSTVAVRRKIN